MFLYIPYGTDAPIYHRPIITVAMIVICYIVYAVTATGPFSAIDDDLAAPYMLAVGNGLHPLQWLTNNFLHAGFSHFLFNMFFLWVFGLVAEGKLGTLKTLALYLGMGILYGATVQILTLGHEPTYCLGASGLIFGLAATCLIWAPRNEIYGVLVIWLIFVKIKHLETKISTMVCIALILQIIVLYLLGGSLSSQLLHLVGAIVGLIIGIVMLKTNIVDCENWDIFSVWAGTNTLSDEERTRIEENKPEAIKRRAEKRQKRQSLLTGEIEWALQNQTPLPGYIIAQRMEQEFAHWTLPQELHLKMIRQLLSGKHWTEATSAMRQYLERHQEQSVFVRLMLTQALLSQGKPKAAIKVLESVPPDAPEQQSVIPKIRAKAIALHAKNLDEGFYEVED